MGWTPRRTNDSSAQGSAAGTPSPAPRRRRKYPPAEDPAPVRPPGGINDSQGYGTDTRSRTQYVQVGKRWSEIIENVRAGHYTWAEFVETLDPDELARGQLKDKNGKFQGRPPKMVPREFLLACQRELKAQFEFLFSKDVLKVTQQYLQMAQRGDIKDETRAKMLQYAMERVFGGIPKDLRISQEAPWESMVVNVMGDDTDREMPEHLRRRYAGYAERQGTDQEEAP